MPDDGEKNVKIAVVISATEGHGFSYPFSHLISLETAQKVVQYSNN
jgi:hypothetical protein